MSNALGHNQTKELNNEPRPENLDASVLQYLDQNKAKYHTDNPRDDLKIESIMTDQFGLNHLHVQRYYQGVPVYGSIIKLHADKKGNILSALGKNINVKQATRTTPLIKSNAAKTIAKKHFVELSQIKINKIKVSTPKLYIYDRAFFSKVPSDPTLVWRLSLESRVVPIQYTYYIDARTGEIVHYLNTVADAQDRETYTLSETPDCNTATLTYDELGLIGTYDVDAYWVHEYVANTYSYYYNTFGRNSYDDENPDDISDGGGTIKSYTHYGDPYDSCKQNFAAAWVNQATEPYEFMYFAEGVYGQDIVGHEFTHGVVDYSADFEYENESGALDESYADIFGTLIEHYTGEIDWTIGEDLPSTRSECTTALRSLADPTAYTGQCDGSGSALPDSDDEKLELADDEMPSDSNDNGYVHTNSSIANYAFYLLAVGGTHPTSGVSVTGIGTSVAAELYYQTLTNYLTISSNFDDAHTATLQACLDLNAADATTYPISYCDSVQQSFYAVGIADTESYLEADIVTSTESGYAPLTVDFDGADSFALNATLTDYVWDFDKSAASPSAWHWGSRAPGRS